ncbi:uncharacterized protein LOC124083051 [Marmota monax]|uniref:uncharacterized protein LOC124083051 n=1 Tax=Marmota monax TaxID=9995 RepID=UPI001EAFCC5D|nr:uncharacterized protein LOC124083051 [Marmota monax]
MAGVLLGWALGRYSWHFLEWRSSLLWPLCSLLHSRVGSVPSAWAQEAPSGSTLPPALTKTRPGHLLLLQNCPTEPAWSAGLRGLRTQGVGTGVSGWRCLGSAAICQAARLTDDPATPGCSVAAHQASLPQGRAPCPLGTAALAAPCCHCICPSSLGACWLCDWPALSEPGLGDGGLPRSAEASGVGGCAPELGVWPGLPSSLPRPDVCFAVTQARCWPCLTLSCSCTSRGLPPDGCRGAAGSRVGLRAWHGRSRPRLAPPWGLSNHTNSRLPSPSPHCEADSLGLSFPACRGALSTSGEGETPGLHETPPETHRGCPLWGAPGLLRAQQAQGPWNGPWDTAVAAVSCLPWGQCWGWRHLKWPQGISG